MTLVLRPNCIPKIAFERDVNCETEKRHKNNEKRRKEFCSHFIIMIYLFLSHTLFLDHWEHRIDNKYPQKGSYDQQIYDSTSHTRERIHSEIIFNFVVFPLEIVTFQKFNRLRWIDILLHPAFWLLPDRRARCCTNNHNIYGENFLRWHYVFIHCHRRRRRRRLMLCWHRH